MIALIFIVVIIILLSWFSRRQTRIPKIIWSFWDGPEKPPIVKACIDSWRRMAPDYDIRILDKETTKHIQKFKKSSESLARYSDFVRLDTLSRYGGVWIDASVYLTKPLDWIQDGSDFVGYKYDSNKQSDSNLPLVVSWFFACTKNSKIVTDWYEEFKRIDEFDSVKDYLSSLDVDYSRVTGPEYLAIYISLLFIRSNHNYENIKLYSIENDTSFDINNFCENVISENTKLIKFDNGHRNYFQNATCKKISAYK